MHVDVTTYYLEMTNPRQLRPKPSSNPNFEIKQVEIPLPELNQFLYTTVGKTWFWTNRLNWTLQQWTAWADRPELKTWIGYLSGTPAGYFELEIQPANTIEVAYFGLLPRFIGQGLGGALLSAAVERAWALNAVRVWVHTCTLDHPRALANYQARGFRIFAQNNHSQELAEPISGN